MATVKQRRAFTYLSENIRSPRPIPLGQVLINSGYTITTSKRPSQVVESKGFQELLEENLPDDLLQTTHREILQSKFIDHMVFPLDMTDDEIKELVSSVGGTVRKFKHSETQTHVWFWSPNPKARLDAVKLAYQVKGKLTNNDQAAPVTNNYATFINNGTINPNAPKARELADETIKILMAKTKRVAVDNTTDNTSQ